MEPLLTIVILTYSRQPQLRRQLLFYENKRVHIVIADASATPWSEGSAGARGSMTWEYIHCPGPETAVQRLKMSMARVTTEYMCFLDDEECILWTGMLRALQYLEDNPSSSCAGGHVARTTETSRGLELVAWGTESDPCHWSSPWRLQDGDPLQRFRMMVMSERTANLYYQILRTATIRAYVANMSDHTYEFPSSLEIAMTGMLALTGKWEMGPYPFWIRHGGRNSASASMSSHLTSADTREILRVMKETTRSIHPSPSEHLSQRVFNEVERLILRRWASPWRMFAARVRRRIYRVLHRYVPQHVGFLLPRRRRVKWCWDDSLTFIEYGRKFGSGCKEELEDLERIYSIWTRYPQGVNSLSSLA